MQLDSFFPYRMAVATESFSRRLAEVYGQGFGLSREEWRLLFLLSQTESLTSLDLARRTTLDKVQVSRAAGRLQNKALIRRAISPDDRRLRVYHCTDAGRALFAQLLPQVAARSEQILATMTADDRAALERGLEALRRATLGS